MSSSYKKRKILWHYKGIVCKGIEEVNNIKFEWYIGSLSSLVWIYHHPILDEELSTMLLIVCSSIWVTCRSSPNIWKVLEFQKRLTIKEKLEFLVSLKTCGHLVRFIPLKQIPKNYWESYSDVSLQRLRWWVTDHWKCYPNMSLQRPRCWVMGHLKGYPDVSLQRPWWHVTKNAMMTGDGSLKRLLWRVTESATLMCHWTGYNDGSLKRLLWRLTENAIMLMPPYYYVIFIELWMKLLPIARGYKNTSWGRKWNKKHTHTFITNNG
jgi:hypothetical protein